MNSSGPVAEYKVGPGDVLQIIVWDNINLTNPFGTAIQDAASTGQLIDSSGHLNFPYVGSFAAAGMTIQEIRRYVSSKLITIKEPQVDVRVVAFRSHRVQVTGEVNSPGVVTLDDTVKGVLEALNERGGLNANASRRVVLLIRDGLTYQINLASLLSGQTAGANPLLVAGDIIQIPDNRGDQIFVMGEINSAGPIVIGQQNLSLSEALAKSGGLDKLTAEDSGVLIFRRADDSNSVARIFGLDMSNPGGMLLAGEFILNPSDVVYIKATNFSQYNSFISQILPTVTAAFQIDSLFQ
ncbi:polysaccharide biosynthesis/export family protein [Hydrocarboniphaga effusa]|nr:polysaccharide biosynthesis/export family protein [Hydrocarboniphaga effusa]